MQIYLIKKYNNNKRKSFQRTGKLMAFDKQQQKLYFKPKHGQKEHISYPKSYLSALKTIKKKGKIHNK